MTVCDSCKQLFDGLSDYCYECRDDMTYPKKLPILGSLNSQEVDMSEPSDADIGEHETWCDCLNGISNRCNCLSGGYIEKIEDLQKELESMTLQRDHWAKKYGTAIDKLNDTQKELEAANMNADHYKHLYEDLLEENAHPKI